MYRDRDDNEGRAETSHNPQIVTEDDVHEAMEMLRSTVIPIGRARGRMIKGEAMLRHIKAIEMTFSDSRTTAAQERDAYASDRYKSAIEELAAASMEFESLKAQREASVMVCEMWRSQRASERAATRI